MKLEKIIKKITELGNTSLGNCTCETLSLESDQCEVCIASDAIDDIVDAIEQALEDIEALKESEEESE